VRQRALLVSPTAKPDAAYFAAVTACHEKMIGASCFAKTERSETSRHLEYGFIPTLGTGKCERTGLVCYLGSHYVTQRTLAALGVSMVVVQGPFLTTSRPLLVKAIALTLEEHFNVWFFSALWSYH